MSYCGQTGQSIAFHIFVSELTSRPSLKFNILVHMLRHWPAQSCPGHILACRVKIPPQEYPNVQWREGLGPEDSNYTLNENRYFSLRLKLSTIKFPHVSNRVFFCRELGITCHQDSWVSPASAVAHSSAPIRWISVTKRWVYWIRRNCGECLWFTYLSK